MESIWDQTAGMGVTGNKFILFNDIILQTNIYDFELAAMPFLLSTLKIEQNIFEDLFLHLQQLRSSSKGAEKSKHLHNTFIIV